MSFQDPCAKKIIRLIFFKFIFIPVFSSCTASSEKLDMYDLKNIHACVNRGFYKAKELIPYIQEMENVSTSAVISGSHTFQQSVVIKLIV